MTTATVAEQPKAVQPKTYTDFVWGLDYEVHMARYQLKAVATLLGELSEEIEGVEGNEKHVAMGYMLHDLERKLDALVGQIDNSHLTYTLKSKEASHA